MVNVIVVFPKLEDAKGIKRLLVQKGFSSVYVCSTGAQALNVANSLNGGVVVSAYRLQDMMYQELNACLPDTYDMLVLVPQRCLSEGVKAGILSLPMPLKTYEFLRTLEMMSEAALRKRRKRRAQLRERDPQQQKMVEEAKKVLMERNHMTEEEAHRYLQKCSMDSGTNMTETAEMIIRIMA